MRRIRIVLALILLTISVPPALAQIIPEPSANRELYIRNPAGKIIQRLAPNGDHYDVFDMKRRFTVIGRGVMLGRRLVIYDLGHNVVATARAELLPPDSDLSNITVVRDAHGQVIGMLERY